MSAAGTAAKPWWRYLPRGVRPTILDRYMIAELWGPFGFGLSAFTLIFAATQVLEIGRMVSTDHAPLIAAIEVFLWSLPGEVVLVIPMALLLGTLLAMQRLSGESEITAMKAGGITFSRMVAPLLWAGIAMSAVTFVLQEYVVPYAGDQLTQITDVVINHTSAFNQDLTVSAPLPGGGKQMTIATAYEPHTQALLHVTLVQYDRNNQPTQVIFADRADFSVDKWTLENMSLYRFNPDGTILAEPRVAKQQVELGEKPTDIVKRLSQNNLDTMSRTEIASIVKSGQLTPTELRKYVTTYQEKLARPFACFVFTLIAVPFGIRAARGGGSTSLGFGLAVAIVFVYYIVMTIFSYIGQAFLPLAPLAAWMPNLIFTAYGVVRLRRAALV
ncbi:MAG TPA: LptF/LptG family permease [Candidatus Baltobacteraceae bacterium]|nr:LptF/LptG family permease [Candidatus Baltobacteraceae bacterium]